MLDKKVTKQIIDHLSKVRKGKSCVFLDMKTGIITCAYVGRYNNTIVHVTVVNPTLKLKKWFIGMMSDRYQSVSTHGCLFTVVL